MEKTLEEKIIDMERFLRLNFGRSNKIYKIFAEMCEEIERLKNKNSKKRLK